MPHKYRIINNEQDISTAIQQNYSEDEVSDGAVSEKKRKKRGKQLFCDSRKVPSKVYRDRKWGKITEPHKERRRSHGQSIAPATGSSPGPHKVTSNKLEAGPRMRNVPK